MKILHLVRHAKSSWNDPLLDDIDRPLNARGIKNASELAEVLLNEEVRIDLLLTSPARRAFNTANAIAEQLALPEKQFRIEPELYLPEAETFIQLIKETINPTNHLMLVGHEPSISTFVNGFLNLRLDKVVTASMTTLTFSARNWADISASNLKSAHHRSRHNWIGASLY